MVRQQRALQQQHLAQQQQHHAGGIPVSMPAGTQGLNQAQLSAMQNPNIGGPAVNMMHYQQQQLLAMQAQAQAQAAAAQAQAQANNQQGQHTPQQRAPNVPRESVTPQHQRMDRIMQSNRTNRPRIAVKATISEDLSGKDDPKVAKLQYLQKKNAKLNGLDIHSNKALPSRSRQRSHGLSQNIAHGGLSSTGLMESSTATIPAKSRTQH
ncbi:uncharacterized protein BHQ10_004434 [Talaromyces amestolkiae]|uniref:Uncharacterized protein n=1 Tax=Talaromyces amestolkiae TaxID=1196081 RepID=A0A364KXY9_TALAM|nr:uncharacterized protein BHQ10_004434 [Talaromyces amestolkiae]RAO68422.1 hypothetical protein BHQ10_004434 [Talaromyces amestolkiae]